jgi:hypothetical protein
MFNVMEHTVTITSGSDVTVFDALRSIAVDLERQSFFGCVGTPHGRGSFAELRYVRGSAVRAREGGKQNK